MVFKLYLDIDGVLLGKNEKDQIVIIPHIKEFLLYTKRTFDCYWLTTHCRYDKEEATRYLRPYLPKSTLTLFSHIKPLYWRTLKTEAIDFKHPFIWIDDSPLIYEIEILKRKDCLKNWLHVDSYKNINDLTIEKLEQKRKEILEIGNIEL